MGGSNGFYPALATDISGNIYLTGETYSEYSIATKGAYKTVGDSSGGDAILAKFNPSGNLLWATYYGGGGTFSYGVCTDKLGNVCITGVTDSVFLAKFSSSGSLLWSTNYGAGGFNNLIGGAASDTSGNIYITGVTQDSTGIATAGAYQTSFAGDSGLSYGDAFLAKFNSNGSLLWGTYFGGKGNEASWAVTTDEAGNVYITGVTSSDSGIATSGAYQTSYGGGELDVFLAKFNTIGSLLGATYYGGKGWDFSVGLAVDRFNNVYITGGTNSDSGIATSGAYQIYINDSGYNGYPIEGFLAKFNFKNYNDAGVSSILSHKRNFCADSMQIKVRLINYGLTTLTSCKINWAINGQTQSAYNWSGSLKTDSAVTITPGNYSFVPGPVSIAVWTSNPNGKTDSFPGNDTAKIIDTIYPLPDANFSFTVSGYTVKFMPKDTNYIAYSWSFGDGSVDSTPHPQHLYSHDGIYTVSLTLTDKNGCSSTYKTTDTINFTGIKTEGHAFTNLKISPNPFSSILSISYTLPQSQNVALTLTDITGKQIATLANENQSSGAHLYYFEASQYNLPAGIYFLRLVTGATAIEQKIVFIK